VKKKILMERIQKIILVFAFILAGLITHGQSVFKDHSIQKRAKEIFNQYPNLDSVAFIFTNDI